MRPIPLYDPDPGPTRKGSSVRLRLVIPAALAAAATYAALVREDARPAPTWAPATDGGDLAAPIPARQVQDPVAVPPPVAIISIVPAPVVGETSVQPEAERTPWPASPYADLAVTTSAAAAVPSVYDFLAGPPPAVPEAELAGGPAEAAADAPTPWIASLDEGRFALGGWAAAPGHSVVAAITFRRRLAADVSIDQIVLEIDASENVPDGGLVVMPDPGFAPDRDGFTLFLAAAEVGAFSAGGSYRVLPT